jgi:hypothetical protein
LCHFCHFHKNCSKYKLSPNSRKFAQSGHPVYTGRHDVTARSEQTRVARWFVFKPKIPIWEKNFWASDWKTLTYFMDIWGIL